MNALSIPSARARPSVSRVRRISFVRSLFSRCRDAATFETVARATETRRVLALDATARVLRCGRSARGSLRFLMNDPTDFRFRLGARCDTTGKSRRRVTGTPRVAARRRASSSPPPPPPSPPPRDDVRETRDEGRVPPSRASTTTSAAPRGRSRAEASEASSRMRRRVRVRRRSAPLLPRRPPPRTDGRPSTS